MKKYHKEGDLRIWWISQLSDSAKAFHFCPSSVEEAAKMLMLLAEIDIVNSYAGGLEIYEDGEWCSWIDPKTGEDDPIEWYLSQHTRVVEWT